MFLGNPNGRQNNRVMPQEPQEVNLTVDQILEQYPWIENPEAGKYIKNHLVYESLKPLSAWICGTLATIIALFVTRLTRQLEVAAQYFINQDLNFPSPAQSYVKTLLLKYVITWYTVYLGY